MPGQGDGMHRNVVVVEEDEEANLKKWLDFMQTMLGCLGSEGFEVEACSISLVPRQLRQSKEEAYTPQVVSIGPLHRGITSSTDLLYMEEIKWRCLLRLIERSKQDKEQVLRNCGKAMLEIDEIARASYNVQVKLNRYELAKIMVLDGCFLLELLIGGSTQLNEQLKCISSDSDSSLVTQAIESEKVLLDLIMLENQIPLVVLSTLSTNLFPNTFTGAASTRLIHEHALSIFGYSSSPDSNIINSPKFKGFHFLQLVHSFIDTENDAIWQQPTTELQIQIPDESPQKVKLERCATLLEAAGVTIKPAKAQYKAKTRFDLKVTFRDGKLRIPQLHITKTTEAKWRNLIAWELNSATLEKQRELKTDRISCQFISYAWFFQSLTCSVHDVKLLRDRKVITVEKERTDKGKKKKIMSNKDLMNLFLSITEEFPEVEIQVDSRFRHVIEKLNSYPTQEDRSMATCWKIIAYGVRGPSKIMWHFFRRFLTWIWCKWIEAYGILKRVYIPSGWRLIAVLAAAAGLALTAIQTYYSIRN
ncbi:hypothetical protein GLYMA_03G061200v4 [Glycine max]|uniref:Uncharacterized protein n=2 Tax=Glycine subgen. Soja TaxID=1462606 RepID=K7KD74_SOYBN|nr:UPF0481 protein At3g47200 [Glycine max]XP_028223455.1 UPF0481 protein At3g47200-like [Glycine soja]KAG5054160.1 hypothetical protein JHK85_006670 [Glycine max]KAH1068776.1 hypothetical protein GYH30_006374 [Glycine max]KRH65785.1 hypothetical protein GLYMA_03G061200v4 [Glycine max]RZC19347.1 UPF0481 protein [Glycine soja]|eukprot:XP_003522085.1 UPF0481 protein At3g47200 [Glycine max]